MAGLNENYDYKLSKGDKLLACIRSVFRKSPEFRHDSLKHVARFAPYIPFLGGRPDLSPGLRAVIRFGDGSLPISLGCPIILAAGANKTAFRIADYANLGFGGISVGTVTRRFREGNTHRPRIGFLERDRAIYNSMGLNNDGVEKVSSRVASQLEKAHGNGLAVGISIAETPGLSGESEKLRDVLECLAKAYDASDYIEINASCPNTGENRLDLDTHFIESLFGEVMRFRNGRNVRKAVYAKLSPDLSEERLAATLEALSRTGVNGVVLGNTYPTKKMESLSMNARYGDLKTLRADGDKGGLSGRPLYPNTAHLVAFAKERFPHLSVIACGGIDHGKKIFDLLRSGADAVECYSVCAFRWMPAHAMRKELSEALADAGLSDLTGLRTK